MRARGPSAFLTIQEGCDKFCTFCVVPYTRGAELSRPVAPIVAEARALAEAGVREVTLLGQNVNAYHGDDPSEAAPPTSPTCAARWPTIDGLDRIRYTTSHPGDLDEDLIAAHRDLPALMPFLHLPVQSGSDRVLKAMNRRHTTATYAALVDNLRAARPDIALSSDFIVGFPGETDADFEATLESHPDDRLRLDLLVQIFAASRARPAADLPDQVPGARHERAPRPAADARRGAAPGLQCRHRRPDLWRAARAQGAPPRDN